MSRSLPEIYVTSEVRLYREGVVSLLRDDSRVAVLGDGCHHNAISVLSDKAPDALLLDVSSPVSTHLTRRALLLAPAVRVIAFAVDEVELDVLACARAGISGYVPQNASSEELVSTIIRTVGGETVCSPRITAQLFHQLGASSPDPPSAANPPLPLTSREAEIAALLVRGMANKEIARGLRLGNATVKNHVHNILQKLNLRRRGEIATIWRNNGAWLPRRPADPWDRNGNSPR